MTQPERETALSRQAEEAVERAEASVSRHRELGPVWMAILVTASSLSVLASIYFIFNVHLMIGVNIFGEETEYYYFMLAMLLLSVPFVFGSIQTGIGYRLVLAGITGICVYLLDQIMSNAGLLLELNHALVALTPGLALMFIGSLWLQKVS